MEYVRKIGRKYWHFCPNCSNYPDKSGIMCKFTISSSDEICEECKKIKEEMTAKNEY